MTDVPAIEFEHLSKSYGAKQALLDVSFSVPAGEVVGFLGPNGAGKTTAIRVLFDFIRPSAGAARVMGLDCQASGEGARAHLGYLPGSLELYENLSGKECIDLFASLRSPSAEPGFIASLLERLNLDPGGTIGSYSKGTKQKLGIVLALMHRPHVLVLDEPTSGLDPLVQEEVAGLLREVADEGSAVFFSSHALSEVERLCHRVAFIRAGKLVAVEEVAAIKGRSLHILEATFSEHVPEGAFALPGVRLLGHNGSSIRLEVHSNLDAVIKKIAGYPLLDLRTEQPSLDDVFLAYYHDSAGLADEI